MEILWVCIEGQGLRQQTELCLGFQHHVEVNNTEYTLPVYFLFLAVKKQMDERPMICDAGRISPLRKPWGNSVELKSFERLSGF